MGLEKILEGKTSAQQVAALKTRRSCSPAPVIEECRKQINPTGHKINDKAYRPDKAIREERDAPIGMGAKMGLAQKKKEKVIVRFEEVNRISIPLQKTIVKRAVSFLFAKPVKLQTKSADKSELLVLDTIKTVNYDNKIDAFNRKVAREVFTFTEAAEYWYPIEIQEDSGEYGFTTKNRLRVALFSPNNGDELFPFFDEHGDMTAFSRQYKIKDENNKDVVLFDTYTADFFYRYRQVGSEWELYDTIPNILKKIPIVYYSQPQTEWDDVQALIERLEKLLSNFAETNDYHASPKIFVQGKINGFSKKAEAGAILEGEKDATAQYLSWDHAPESVKLEIDTLLKLIYSMTQTPDISFDSVKGLGDVSGIALKLLFMDAHLKGYDHIELFGEAIQRRTSIQKAYIATLNKSNAKAAKSVQIKPEFTLFMLDNDKELVEMMVTANGNKPIVSQKESIRIAGISPNPEEDYDVILEETKRDQAQQNTFSAF